MEKYIQILHTNTHTFAEKIVKMIQKVEFQRMTEIKINFDEIILNYSARYVNISRDVLTL